MRSSCRPPWTRSSSSTPTAASTCKTLRGFAGKPEWTAMITVDDSPWGRRPAGYGQTEVMGLATFNALQPSIGHRAGGPRPSWHRGRSTPTAPSSLRARPERSRSRGPTVMNGYFNRPELNEQRQAGGWHHTNDLGRVEADGSLTFIGPKGRSSSRRPRTSTRPRSRGAQDAPRGGRRGGDRRPRPHLGAERHGRGGAGARGGRPARRRSSSTAGNGSPRTRSRSSVEFTDALPRNGLAIDYDALDAAYGGGGYPGAGH